MIVKDWLKKSKIVMAAFAFVITALLLCKGDTVYAAAPIATDGYFDVDIYEHGKYETTSTRFRVHLNVPTGSNSASSYYVSAIQELKPGDPGANCMDVTFSSGMSKQDGWAFVNPPQPDRYFITPITVDLRKVNGNSDYFIYDYKLTHTTEQNAGDGNTFVFDEANNKVTIDIDTNNSGLTALAGEGGLASAHCTLEIEVARKNWNVRVHPNGGTYNGTTDTTTRGVTYGEETWNNIGKPSRTGYTFDGWYTADGTEVYDKNGKWVKCVWWGDNGRYHVLGDIDVYAHWTKNSFKQTVKVRYQKSDGTWGSYSDVINKNYDYGSTVSWSRNQDDTYKATSLSYTVYGENTKKIDVYRRKYHQTLKVKWQKSDGTWTDFTKKIDGDYYYGATVGAWSQPDNAEYKGTSSSSYTVSKAETKELLIYRKQYTQIVNVKYQDSSKQCKKTVYASVVHIKMVRIY